MTDRIKVGAALAVGCLFGWFSNAQIIQGQTKQGETPVMGNLSHISFVVTDAEKTIKAFADVFGVQGEPTVQDVRDISWGPRFPGKKMHTRDTRVLVNGTTLEVLQPLDGESPWKDFMAKSGEGVHHI